jgi:hypothetical protein
MQVSYYFRSPILNWYELSQEQQQEYPEADFSESSFVFNDQRNYILCLDEFIRIDRPGRFHGVFGQTYFSAYFIHLSKCGSAAVVAYRYC